jgi:hypothetical protein
MPRSSIINCNAEGSKAPIDPPVITAEFAELPENEPATPFTIDTPNPEQSPFTAVPPSKANIGNLENSQVPTKRAPGNANQYTRQQNSGP